MFIISLSATEEASQACYVSSSNMTSIFHSIFWFNPQKLMEFYFSSPQRLQAGDKEEWMVPVAKTSRLYFSIALGWCPLRWCPLRWRQEVNHMGGIMMTRGGSVHVEHLLKIQTLGGNKTQVRKIWRLKYVTIKRHHVSKTSTPVWPQKSSQHWSYGLNQGYPRMSSNYPKCSRTGKSALRGNV